MLTLAALFLALVFQVGGERPPRDPYEPNVIAKEIEATGSSDVIYRLVEEGDPKKTVFALLGVSGMFARGERKEQYPEVYQKAVSAIIGIDGHARFFSERIHKMTEEPRSGRSRATLFRVFSKIRSRECIIEVASFLDHHYVHPRDIERLGSDRYIKVIANSSLAATTLNEMSLPGAPTSGQVNGTGEEIVLWSKWWEENKERYLSKRKASPLRGSRHSGARESPDRPQTKTQTTPSLLIVIAILLAAAALALWWWLWRREAKPTA